MAVSLILPYPPIALPCLIVAGSRDFANVKFWQTQKSDFRALLWAWSWPCALCCHVLPVPTGAGMPEHPIYFIFTAYEEMNHCNAGNFLMHNRQSYKTLGMGAGQVTRALVVMAQLKVI